MAVATRPEAPDPEQASRRWPALAFIGLAQLMVALDATIVSIARYRRRSARCTSPTPTGSG
jgi:hypothetical protein